MKKRLGLIPGRWPHTTTQVCLALLDSKLTVGPLDPSLNELTTLKRRETLLLHHHYHRKLFLKKFSCNFPLSLTPPPPNITPATLDHCSAYAPPSRSVSTLHPPPKSFDAPSIAISLHCASESTRLLIGPSISRRTHLDLPFLPKLRLPAVMDAHGSLACA